MTPTTFTQRNDIKASVWDIAHPRAMGTITMTDLGHFIVSVTVYQGKDYKTVTLGQIGDLGTAQYAAIGVIESHDIKMEAAA
jgi:hypothetical protein